MPVYISMLRAINVGGHAVVKMDALRETYRTLGFSDVQSYVQSGNLIFRARAMSEASLGKKIQAAIEEKFKVRPEVLLRSVGEMRAVIAANPFAKRKDVPPNKLLVSFLGSEPSAEARKKLKELQGFPEEIHLIGRELFIYFPEGMGNSKLPPVLDRTLKTPATGRNWNTVTKMLEIAEKLEQTK